MAPEIEQLSEQVMKLPTKARAELASRILRSLEDDLPEEEEGSEEEILRAWGAEALRRDAEIERGEVVARPYDEVMREVREKLR
jgi:hypothetical protein